MKKEKMSWTSVISSTKRPTISYYIFCCTDSCIDCYYRCRNFLAQNALQSSFVMKLFQNPFSRLVNVLVMVHSRPLAILFKWRHRTVCTTNFISVKKAHLMHMLQEAKWMKTVKSFISFYVQSLNLFQYLLIVPQSFAGAVRFMCVCEWVCYLRTIEIND